MSRFESSCGAKGFTLLEIVSVLVLIALLATLAVARYVDLTNAVERQAALASVEEAQARIHGRFAELLLDSKSCAEARLQALDLAVLADEAGGAEGPLFGNYHLTPHASLIDDATGKPIAVSATNHKSRRQLDNVGFLVAPLCHSATTGTPGEGDGGSGGTPGTDTPDADGGTTVVDGYTEWNGIRAIEWSYLKETALQHMIQANDWSMSLWAATGAQSDAFLVYNQATGEYYLFRWGLVFNRSDIDGADRLLDESTNQNFIKLNTSEDNFVTFTDPPQAQPLQRGSLFRAPDGKIYVSVTNNKGGLPPGSDPNPQQWAQIAEIGITKFP